MPVILIILVILKNRYEKNIVNVSQVSQICHINSRVFNRINMCKIFVILHEANQTLLVQKDSTSLLLSRENILCM